MCPDQQAAVGAPAWIGDPIRDLRAPLRIATTATAHSASEVRRAFTAWLVMDLPAGDLPDGDMVDDLVLVVYEAVANTVDHAYVGAGAGPVELLARRSAHAVHITVTDHGTWRCPPAPSRPTGTAATWRGRGLPLIRLLVPDVHIQHGTDGGTTVHLRAPLPAPPRSGP